jgi:hypothetical protein
MTERYACLDVKNFPLQALLRLRPELQSKPVAVLDGEPPFEQVCSLNGAALNTGDSPGHDTVGNGDVSYRPGVATLARRGGSGSSSFAGVCRRFSPRVEDQSSDSCFTCVIDIAGTETLFGSPDALGESLLKRHKHSAYEHPSLSAATFMPPCAWREGTFRQMRRHTGGAARNGMRCTRAFTTHGSRSFPGTCGNIRHVGHHDTRSTGESQGNRIDCAAGTTGQRNAPAGTRRIAAFISPRSRPAWLLKSEWSWTHQ